MDLTRYVPSGLANVRVTQDLLPRIAKQVAVTSEIEDAVTRVPTRHKLMRGDARSILFEQESVHLVLTSPPYWTLKSYPEAEGQLGLVSDYEVFVAELDRVWQRCYHALAPGGRLVCVVGDVCLSRKGNNGNHTVIPLHSSIQEHLRKIGFSNLAPIIWHKIANAKYEMDGGTGFMGKPYEPGSIIKNDIEFIIMARKPGGYRKVAEANRILSVISEKNHKEWFRQIWTDIRGASTQLHPAPFPVELAERLIRMFSFVDDVVLDPFMGTGSTNLAAAKWGRNSIGIEVQPSYLDMALNRLRGQPSMFNHITVEVEEKSEQPSD